MLLKIALIITLLMKCVLSSRLGFPLVHLAPQPIPPVAHSSQFFARDFIHKGLPVLPPAPFSPVPIPLNPVPVPQFHPLAIPQSPNLLSPPRDIAAFPIYHGHKHFVFKQPLPFYPSYFPYHKHIVPRHLHHYHVYHG
jgi:hypothetical protein